MTKAPVTARRITVVLLSVALPAVLLSSSADAAKPQARRAHQAAAQVLTWTADNSITGYASAPTTATAGPATIVFETSAATGNTSGVSHTLTFDLSGGPYNNDVSLNIIASPFDAQGGHHEVEVNLTPGTYHYYCAMPGHQMTGELVVTDGGGGTDTTAPQVSASLSGDKNADGNYVGSATVTVSASDTESGVDTVEYALDGAAYTAYSAPVTVNEVGSHTVKYRATDKAGNTSPEGSVSFDVVAPPDTTAPQVSASLSGDQDTDGNYVGSATVTVSASDTESGVATVEYALDSAPYTAYSGPVTVNEVGSHTVKYRATDKAGNTSPAGSVSFDVVAPQGNDTTPPQVSATVSGDKNPDGTYDGKATVTVSASDTESGVDTVEYAIDEQPFTAYSNPVVVDQPGAHAVQFRATDKAGNTSAAGSVSFTVAAPQQQDKTPPEVSASVSGDKDAEGRYLGSATVTVSASDTESGVATVEYALDGGAFTGYSAPVSVNDAGAHTVKYRATDKAGNTSDVGSVAFTVVVPQGEDTTPPKVSAQLTGSQDSSWSYVGSATVTISASDTESGVDTVEYALDGQPFAKYAKAFVVDQPGTHTVRFRATDKAGNTSDVGTGKFTVVKAGPSSQCPKPGKGPGCKK